MANSLAAFGQVLRRAFKPKTDTNVLKAALLHAKEAGDLKPNAAFKRKYGILSKAGKAKPASKRVDSDWGFPLPPKGHPQAKRYAHAVLARAHQATKYDAADVAKLVKRAKSIIGEKPAKEARALLREYMPITPKGSWERTYEKIASAAKVNPAFGGSVDLGPRWCISIWASYPDKSAVVIANSDTGELWLAKYQIDDLGNVEFTKVVPAEQSLAVKEALRANAKRLMRENKPGRKVVPIRSRESGKPAKLTESLKLHAKIREVQVDDDGKGARAVCVMLAEGPGNAADGHYYTRDCIEQAAESGVFEGAQSFADHMDELEERNRPERSVRDLVGWWSDTKVEEANGRAYLIGTFNIETGNDFALNKMREAKRFSERYPDGKKQYVGFSIYAGGLSESREINGKPYNAVLQITEAGSTDMVTRAGAGGRMLSLKEEQRMAQPTSLDARREKKLAESVASIVLKKLEKSGSFKERTATRVKAAISEAFDALAESLDDEVAPHIGKMKDAVAKHVAKAIKGEKPEMDEEDDDGMGMEALDDEPGFDEGATGDADMDELLGDTDSDEDEDDADEDDDDEFDPSDNPKEGKRKESATVLALRRENEALKLREKARTIRETARKLVREANVPKAMQKNVLTFLESLPNEKAMRAYLGTIAPSFRESVNGNGERRPLREGTNGGLLTISGLE